MRTLMTFVAALLSLVCTQKAAAEEIFAELSKMPSVESSFISGRFAHNKKLWQNANGSHAMNLSGGFSALYTYQCYSAESIDKAKKILDAYLKKNPDVELVMSTREHSSEYVIYERFDKEDRLKEMIIWDLEGPNLCEIVVVYWENGYVRDTSENIHIGKSGSLDFNFSLDDLKVTGAYMMIL